MLAESHALQTAGIDLMKYQLSPISARQSHKKVLVRIREHVMKQMNADVVLLVVLQQ